MLALAYPVIIVRARLLSLGNSYEEAAMDLGASPMRTLKRVTLPLLGPSIFASAAIIFAFALDDFVIVEQLSRDASTQTVAMTIYAAVRTQPTPAANAIGTLMLTASTLIIADRGDRVSAVGTQDRRSGAADGRAQPGQRSATMRRSAGSNSDRGTRTRSRSDRPVRRADRRAEPRVPAPSRDDESANPGARHGVGR